LRQARCYENGTIGQLGLIQEDDPQLNLAFALLAEWLDGETSPWWGYLQTLPWTDPPPLALFWQDSESADSDGEEATLVVQGSDLAHALQVNGSILKGSIAHFFAAVVNPVLAYRYPHLSSSKRYSMFKIAYSLISSRSFVVDAWHGPAMVPIADAFNHMEDYGVCIYTEFEVCRQCGAFSRCDHDSPPSSPVPADLGAKKEEDTADMVTSKPHDELEEIFNTYSHSKPLSNVQLLLQYGFIEEGNSADRVTFSLEEIEFTLGIAATLDRGALYIDGDGEPSPALRSALANLDNSSRHRVVPCPSNPASEEIIAHAGDSRLSQLCIARLQKLYAQGNVEALATAIDSVPPSKPKTALAYRYLMTETLLLRACLERAHEDH